MKLRWFFTLSSKLYTQPKKQYPNENREGRSGATLNR